MRPPKMTYLSTLSANWNEYGTRGVPNFELGTDVWPEVSITTL